MKKILFSFLVAGAGILSAQVISFEQSEGFFPGSLHNQGGWTITGDGLGGQITDQDVVDSMSSDGSQSFHNAYVEAYGPQDLVMGGFYEFENPIPITPGFTLSFDFYLTAPASDNSSQFSFNIADLDLGYWMTRIFFNNGTEGNSINFTGNSEMGEGQYHPTTGVWTPDTWHNLRFEYDGFMIYLYLNNELISSGLPFGMAQNLDYMSIVHNNVDGDAYYDNIRFNDTASVSDIAAAKSVSILYPNPATDIVNIKLAEDFQTSKTTVMISNMVGQSVASFNNVNDVNVAKLPAGVYVLSITDGVKTETKKLIKK